MKNRDIKILLMILQIRLSNKCYDAFQFHIEQLRRRNKLSNEEAKTLELYLKEVVPEEQTLSYYKWMDRVSILDGLIKNCK